MDPRIERERAVGALYRPLTPDVCTCAYCGAPAHGIDHVPNLSLAYSVGPSALGVPLWLVPACAECNSALAASSLLTVEERRVYLSRWYRKRYAGPLRAPEWSLEDLEEMGPGLRGRIEAEQQLAGWIRRRLEILGRNPTEDALPA